MINFRTKTVIYSENGQIVMMSCRPWLKSRFKARFWPILAVTVALSLLALAGIPL